jgi:hypothetical protein
MGTVYQLTAPYSTDMNTYKHRSRILKSSTEFFAIVGYGACKSKGKSVPAEAWPGP